MNTLNRFALTAAYHLVIRPLDSIGRGIRRSRVRIRKALGMPPPPPAVAERMAQGLEYVATIPPVSGFIRCPSVVNNMASCVVHGFELTPLQALPVLRSWGEKFDPPYEDAELYRALLASRDDPDPVPPGYFLKEIVDE